MAPISLFITCLRLSFRIIRHLVQRSELSSIIRVIRIPRLAIMVPPSLDKTQQCGSMKMQDRTPSFMNSDTRSGSGTSISDGYRTSSSMSIAHDNRQPRLMRQPVSESINQSQTPSSRSSPKTSTPSSIPLSTTLTRSCTTIFGSMMILHSSRLVPSSAQRRT